MSSIEQMLDSFTINGAKSLSLERTSGSLETGKSADFIVLNRNILGIPTKLIGDPKQTYVLFAYLRGRKIFEKAAIK